MASFTLLSQCKTEAEGENNDKVKNKRYGAAADTGFGNRGLVMNFFLYEDEGKFFGYLSIEEWEYLEMDGESYIKRICQRMLATVSAGGGEVLVHFYENIPTELSEDFSMEGEREESHTDACRLAGEKDKEAFFTARGV